MLRNLDRTVLISRRWTWEVSVGPTYNELLCFFGEGWEQYVAAHDLHQREFIMFEHIGDFTFDPIVMGHNSCEKTFPNSENESESEDDDAGDDVGEGNNGNENLHFETTLADWAFSYGYVNIPTPFARTNNMLQNKSVELQSAIGKSWNARIVASSGHYQQVRLTRLNDFLSDKPRCWRYMQLRSH